MCGPLSGRSGGPVGRPSSCLHCDEARAGEGRGVDRSGMRISITERKAWAGEGAGSDDSEVENGVLLMRIQV
eukprot:360555-Chlamydomonas_euryale.AAC.3